MHSKVHASLKKKVGICELQITLGTLPPLPVFRFSYIACPGTSSCPLYRTSRDIPSQQVVTVEGVISPPAIKYKLLNVGIC